MIERERERGVREREKVKKGSKTEKERKRKKGVREREKDKKGSKRKRKRD